MNKEEGINNLMKKVDYEVFKWILLKLKIKRKK